MATALNPYHRLRQGGRDRQGRVRERPHAARGRARARRRRGDARQGARPAQDRRRLERRLIGCASCWLTAAGSSSTAGCRRRWRSSGPTSTTRSGRPASLRDQPELLLAAHRAFVEAGAEIVISASYQAPDELLAESVRIARRAGVLVAGSARRTARRWRVVQEYTGDYDIPDGRARAAPCCCCWRREPDCLAIETQPRARRGRGDRFAAVDPDTLDCLGDLHLPRRRAHVARRAPSRTRCGASPRAAGRGRRRQLHRAGVRR